VEATFAEDGLSTINQLFPVRRGGTAVTKIPRFVEEVPGFEGFGFLRHFILHGLKVGFSVHRVKDPGLKFRAGQIFLE
jgi:hypothetical protein